MGIAAAPLEFLVGATINDIYYVHERSLPVALWNLALINGANYRIFGGFMGRHADAVAVNQASTSRPL